jgi:hypothetical protein
VTRWRAAVALVTLQFFSRLLIMVVLLGTAGGTLGVETGGDLSAPEAARIAREVVAFAETVARDVTGEGPSAWRRHFSESPAFFMAVDGQLAFRDSETATRGIEEASRAIPHIELHWQALRVDPLTQDLAMLASPYLEVQVDRAGHRTEERGFFSGLAEHRAGRWQFRNAHWSSLALAPHAP